MAKVADMAFFWPVFTSNEAEYYFQSHAIGEAGKDSGCKSKNGTTVIPGGCCERDIKKPL
jgi:hypothetical protein